MTTLSKHIQLCWGRRDGRAARDREDGVRMVKNTDKMLIIKTNLEIGNDWV